MEWFLKKVYRVDVLLGDRFNLRNLTDGPSFLFTAACMDAVRQKHPTGTVGSVASSRIRNRLASDKNTYTIKLQRRRHVVRRASEVMDRELLVDLMT
jgi:hypothetical protein